LKEDFESEFNSNREEWCLGE